MQKVLDGDTIVISNAEGKIENIRLSDIDAPETYHEAFSLCHHSCRSVAERLGQPGAAQATNQLQTLLSPGEEITAECYELDRFRRSVCHIFKDGSNINLEMLKSGWAWLSTRREWIRDPLSRDAAAKAKVVSKGAWAIQGQIHPARWRKKCWYAEEQDRQCPGGEKLPP